VRRLEPYADMELLSYALFLPTYVIRRKGESKWILREAMRERLPESIRGQPRVGTLERIARDGYMKNREKVREQLLQDRAWSRYVDTQWMDRILAKGVEPTDRELMILWFSLNIGPWHRAMSPGGSLEMSANEPTERCSR